MVHHPLRLILDGEALVANWRSMRDRSAGAACGAAVKANGYGLGAGEVVERLAAAGCRDFFVSTYAEAEALMPWPAGLGLSVLHGVGTDDMEAALASPAIPVLNSPNQVDRWRTGGQGRPCHVMVDTGMNRLGLTPAEARSGLLSGLNIDTLMSHLSCADEPDHAMNGRQLEAFQALRHAVPARRYSLANSAGICLGPDYLFDLTRPGIAIYGGQPVPYGSGYTAEVRQVARIEAQIIQVRTMGAGEAVGYGATYVASEDQKVAIVNLGYADGLLRQFRELGIYYVDASEWHPLPILGRISMDLTAVLAPDHLPIVEGGWLTFPLDLPRMAAATNLNQYEVLTILGSRYEREWR